jgi:hypothetical protein
MSPAYGNSVFPPVGYCIARMTVKKRSCYPWTGSVGDVPRVAMMRIAHI